MQQWLSARREVEARTGAHERRLYCVLMYCDDSLIIVVGAPRAIRVLRCWRRLVTDMGLLMAVPEKRTIGVWCVWIGALIFAGLGLVAVPRAKIIRASAAIRELCSRGVEFAVYRSLMGLLEHIRCVVRVPKRFMHGLYAPHGPDGEGRRGPNTLVVTSPLMAKQFRHWLELLIDACGCAVTRVLMRYQLIPRATSTFLTASDAATDSHPPGMGGYCHGVYWHFEVATEHLQWLHITVLELLACAFNILITSRMLPPKARMLQLVDATSAFYTLVNDASKSAVLAHTHQLLVESHVFSTAMEKADISHASGDANLAGDASSRSNFDRLQQLAEALGVRLTKAAVPEECVDLYHRVLHFAQSRGIRVSQSRRPPTAPLATEGRSFLELLEMGLGKRRRDCVDADGPESVVERKRARLPATAREPTPSGNLVGRIGNQVARKKRARMMAFQHVVGEEPRPTAAPQPSRSNAPRAPTRMPSRVVGGVRLAVPSFERSTATPNLRRLYDGSAAMKPWGGLRRIERTRWPPQGHLKSTFKRSQQAFAMPPPWHSWVPQKEL